VAKTSLRIVSRKRETEKGVKGKFRERRKTLKKSQENEYSKSGGGGGGVTGGRCSKTT